MTSSQSVADLALSITQREWLSICRALDAHKDEVLEHDEFLIPAVAWVSIKRRDGRADWDAVLELTDTEAIEAIGLGDEDDDPKAVSPSASGDSDAPDSVSPPDSAPATLTT